MLLTALAILMPRVVAAQATAYYTLYSFKGDPDGAQPQGGLVIGKAGALYGTTYAGGTSKLGTVFELTPTTAVPWEETVLHDFSGPDGEYPASALVFGSTGALYGTTGGGGGGSGAIFELAPPSTSGGAWTETVLYAFGGGQNVYPIGGLLIGPGGTLYTTTRGSAVGGVGVLLGLVIALSPPATPGGEWTEDQLYTFGATQGEQPMAGVVSEGGSLFGTTLFGGDENVGTVYELTPPVIHGDAWIETTIHTFPGSPDGEIPAAALTVGPGGVLYGTTTGGGGSLCPRPEDGPEYGCGVVFQLTPPATPGAAWTESVIYSFTGLNGDGAYPAASVALGKNGVLYGTTQNGGSATSACPGSYYVLPGCGIVFELTPPTAPGGGWTETILHTFTGQNGDGANPEANLALSPSGVLYGTATAGGTAGKGTVFAIKP
ncbi:MAG TPA: choice-of-anchor tandem repeat GloVer-containing protein [Bryobacteraceae bacterium]|nr:choice-of-anchor tandem repeat GloVer-containing protein [Bryobacteraceae bacterium]